MRCICKVVQYIKLFQGTLCSSENDFKNTTYNDLIEMENRETAYYFLKVIAKDDPVNSTKNGLLVKPERRRFWLRSDLCWDWCFPDVI
jgi:hypothetical protein